MSDPGFLKADTLALHAGQQADPVTGARAVPIYQTTAYEFENTEQAAARFNLETGGHIYVRLSNPTVGVLEERFAAMHGASGGIATSSGHAALHMIVATLCSAGDHIVASRALYGGSINFLMKTMPRFGVTTTLVDPSDMDAVKAAITPDTQFIMTEVIGNPGLDVADIDAWAAVAEEAGLPLVVDNTFQSPSLFRPMDHGATLVFESATKWIGGHGIAMGGLIADSGRFNWSASRKANGSSRFPTLCEPYSSYNDIVYTDSFGPMAFTMRVRSEGLRDFGCTLSPQNAFYLLQGFETLPLRMERHIANTKVVLEFLQKQEAVTWVRHPDLPDFKGHDVAQRLLPKGSTSMITFGLKGGLAAGRKFIDNVDLLSHVANVGDAKTLVTHPATTTHMQLGPEGRAAAGVGEDMIRLSVGLEDPADIIADLKQAIKKSQR